MGLSKYFTRAFANRWNLLALFAGVGFGLLSGKPDVVLPLVLAGEVAYLGLLGSHPKFQRFVDAQEAKARRSQGHQQGQQALERMLQSLPKPALARFEALRGCCVELQQIAAGMRSPGAVAAPLEDLQLGRLDRLMWMFLRLLYTEHALERFLQTTNANQIDKEIAQLESQIAGLADAQDDHRLKIRRALEDNLATCRDRRANVQRATENLQLVRLELNRLENKIRSISEMAINRQEPHFISDQVDEVAASLLDTEKTMNDLQFATGLDALDDAIPSLVRAAPAPPPPPPPAKKKQVQ